MTLARPIDTTVAVAGEASLLHVHHVVDEAGRVLGFGIIEHTKLITAAAELTRNIAFYAERGSLHIEEIGSAGRIGLRLTFADRGPGIADVSRAMEGGYSTGKGLGLGLPGAKRLVHEFSIDSTPGAGTTVIVVLWRR